MTDHLKEREGGRSGKIYGIPLGSFGLNLLSLCINTNYCIHLNLMSNITSFLQVHIISYLPGAYNKLVS